jgi:hypothetical protein
MAERSSKAEAGFHPSKPELRCRGLRRSTPDGILSASHTHNGVYHMA